jgi:hypothetical protein
VSHDPSTTNRLATVRILLLAILFAAVVLVPGALAQGGDGLSSWTLGGGGTYAGGDYSLAGTAGQAEAATWSGGDYTLVGGFWSGGAATPGSDYAIFLPVVMRNH